MQHNTEPKCHLVEKAKGRQKRLCLQGIDRGIQLQSQNQKYLENRRFYGQVTYSNYKQAYVFVENDTIVPIENSMYVIYHNLTKQSLGYDKKQTLSNKLIYKNIN